MRRWITLYNVRNFFSQSRSRAVLSFIRRKSMIVLKSCLFIMCVVGWERHFSNSLESNVRTTAGRCFPGRQEDKQLPNFSSKSITDMQVGTSSKRLRKDDRRMRTFGGNNMPLGALPRQTLWRTFADQKLRIIKVAVAV